MSKFGNLSTQQDSKTKSKYVGRTGLIYKQVTYKNKEGVEIKTWQAKLKLDHGISLLLTITPEIKGSSEEQVILGNATLFQIEAI